MGSEMCIRDRLWSSWNASKSSSPAVRALFALRWKLGEWFGWDDPKTGLCSRVPTLRDRLPADLSGEEPGPEAAPPPFTPLYVTGDEWAAEIANDTMHGVMHVGWVRDPVQPGGYRGQMAVLVKPNGRKGAVYMKAIEPFRHLIVYPRMLREMGRRWRNAAAQASARPLA